jgi:hypothetical protein
MNTSPFTGTFKITYTPCEFRALVMVTDESDGTVHTFFHYDVDTTGQSVRGSRALFRNDGRDLDTPILYAPSAQAAIALAMKTAVDRNMARLAA